LRSRAGGAITTLQMATIESEALEAGEAASIRAWRLAALERGGYESPLAGELAEQDGIDLHLAVDLLRRGCSQELAAKILL
jgi:hypothetical protein